MAKAFILSEQILGAKQVLRRAVAQAYPVIRETEIGDILVQAGSEPLIIVFESTPYQGSYVINPAALAVTPISLVPPAIAGTPAIGQALRVKPGLWSHDGTLAAPVLYLAMVARQHTNCWRDYG